MAAVSFTVGVHPAVPAVGGFIASCVVGAVTGVLNTNGQIHLLFVNGLGLGFGHYWYRIGGFAARVDDGSGRGSGFYRLPRCPSVGSHGALIPAQ